MVSLHATTLQKVCDDLHIQCKQVGASQVLLEITVGTQKLHFVSTKTPFNDQTVVEIVRDKGLTYDVLGDVISMPRTELFIDPDAAEVYQPYVQQSSVADLVVAIEQEFTYPFIVKKASGSQGKHVYKVTDSQELTRRIQAIFTKDTDYDHVLLVQDYIPIKKEFRVTVFEEQILLVYEKVFDTARFVDNLSPLHWEGSSARIVTADIFISRLADFIKPIYQKLDLKYGGLDIVEDINGKLYLLEINSHPAYNHLVASEGIEPLEKIYRQMITSLQKVS